MSLCCSGLRCDPLVLRTLVLLAGKRERDEAVRKEEVHLWDPREQKMNLRPLAAFPASYIQVPKGKNQAVYNWK